MLTWNVTYHCAPGRRDAFYSALTELGVRENSIHEDGNLKYDYYFDAQDPDALLLIESWESPEFQQIHCQTDIFARLQALKAEFCKAVSIDKFNI